MNRRTALRHVVLLSAGAALLPSCTGNDKTATIPLKNLSLTPSQEDMMAALSEAIIPKTTSFIGASDLRSHEFVLIMVDDCHSPEDQKAFMDGMKEFETACDQKWQKSFTKCSPQQKKEFLQDAEKKQNMTENAVKFYQATKRYSLQSFTSSERYMTDIRNYKMVPGPNYKGCVAV
jgi:hypothetical protein